MGIVYLSFIYIPEPNKEVPEITSFDECVLAGNQVMESYPRQCRSADGRLFVEVLEDPINPFEPREPGAYDGCLITGCSAQICAGEEMVTTCEYREEYACFKKGICERGDNGVCGWREDQTLSQCLTQLE